MSAIALRPGGAAKIVSRDPRSSRAHGRWLQPVIARRPTSLERGSWKGDDQGWLIGVMGRCEIVALGRSPEPSWEPGDQTVHTRNDPDWILLSAVRRPRQGLENDGWLPAGRESPPRHPGE